MVKKQSAWPPNQMKMYLMKTSVLVESFSFIKSLLYNFLKWRHLLSLKYHMAVLLGARWVQLTEKRKHNGKSLLFYMSCKNEGITQPEWKLQIVSFPESAHGRNLDIWFHFWGWFWKCIWIFSLAYSDITTYSSWQTDVLKVNFMSFHWQRKQNWEFELISIFIM